MQPENPPKHHACTSAIYDLMLEHSALVVAHPDDEILWASSVADKVGQVLICFLAYPADTQSGPARKRSLEEHPVRGIHCLGLDEADSFNGGDWRLPVLNEYGIELSKKPEAETAYRKNAAALRNLLRERLAGVKNVITHNPWGEYGHEDHIQVYRVLSVLSQELGFQLWFSNYVSNRSLELMLRYVTPDPDDYLSLPTNTKLAQSAVEVYRRNGCWTWYPDWRWFDFECFVRARDFPAESPINGRWIPVNLIKFAHRPAKPAQPPGLKQRAGKVLRKLLK
jgi:LmbE family N-acetylglucosaminyl deacetylase